MIPKPIRSHHRNLFSLDTSVGGGKMFMHQKTRSLLIKCKKGYLVPFEFGVRLNITHSNQIEFVGALNFHKSNTDSCVLILDNEGRIREMTKPALNVFNFGENISKYNKEFEEINEVNFTYLN